MGTAAKKKKTGSTRASLGPFDVWNGKTVGASFSWDDGVKNLKGSPRGKFTLKDVSGSATEFAVEFERNKMPTFWKNVTLKSKGTEDPPQVDTLPRLADLTFTEMVLGLRDVIVEAKRAGTRIRRLEGKIEVPNGGGPATPHQVRMMYLPGVMKPDNAGGAMRDFAVIVFRDPSGGQDPNGGGSGPPDL